MSRIALSESENSGSTEPYCVFVDRGSGASQSELKGLGNRVGPKSRAFEEHREVSCKNMGRA